MIATKNRYRLHVIGLPHAPTSRDHFDCAFTGNVYKFCQMMTELGHDVQFYGREGSDPPASAKTVILTSDEAKRMFPPQDHANYYPIKWDDRLEYWQIFNGRAAEYIRQRHSRNDFVCLIGGITQKPVLDSLYGLNVLGVEYAIGYYATCAPYRCFPSYSHQSFVYGRQAHDPDGGWMDAVIPHALNVEDFTFNDRPGDHALFMGRVTSRKGYDIAIEATKRAGKKLIICGQDACYANGKLMLEGRECNESHVQYVGYADIKKRNELLGNAQVVLCPTKYNEPFGMVAIEAQACGTPVVSTDWGAFPETVKHGCTGYRCRTLEQFVWAVKNARTLNRKLIRKSAIARYSTRQVAAMYDEWFSTLQTVFYDGWYASRNRDSLDDTRII